MMIQLASFKTRVLFALTAFIVGLAPALSLAAGPQEVLRDINARFRSSSQDIDAQVLMDEAFPKIGSELLKELSRLKPEQIVQTYARDASLRANKAVVENALRLQILTQICQSLCIKENLNRDVSQKFWALNPEKMMAGIPEISSENILPADFDYTEYQMKKMAETSPLNNDWYNFKMAGAYFSEGMKDNNESTFRLFSRGHANRNFILAFGVEQVVDLLESLHFSDADIRNLKNNPELKNLSPEFFEYLRNFKFSGSIRAVKDGTVVFTDEPILEITGNTVEVTIVETLLIPWINKMSNFATKAARVVDASGGRLLVEGGTRRGVDGFWSALAALFVGFHKTSNIEVARLTNQAPVGTEAHQWIGHFGKEILGHSVYRKYYPETTLLVDTYDILEGVKIAVRASGPKFKGIRLDSAIPGLSDDPVESKRLTALKVQKLLTDLGYDAKKYTITYSDGLTEHSLKQLTEQKTPFQVALVGTEVAAPSDVSHLNTVYKAVEVLDKRTGKTHWPIKLATGKVLQPGKTQLYRVYDENGKIKQDILAIQDEEVQADGRVEALLHPVMKDGHRLNPRRSIEEVRAYVGPQMDALTAEMRSFEPMKTKFKAVMSEGALKAQDIARQGVISSDKLKVGYVFMSGDPMHDSHQKMIERAIQLYNLDRVYVVLTGDERVHKQGAPMFNGQQRLALAGRRFDQTRINEHKVVLWSGEIEGRTKYSIDTIADIEKSHPELARSDRFMIVGSDTFKTLSSWKGADKLAKEFNWVVVSRDNDDFNLAEANKDLLKDFTWLNGDSIKKGADGNHIEVVNLNVGELSSTQIRDRISKVQYLLIDNSTENSLSEALAQVKWLSHKSPYIKTLQTTDSPSFFTSELTQKMQTQSDLDQFNDRLQDPLFLAKVSLQIVDSALQSLRARDVILVGDINLAEVRSLLASGHQVSVVSDTVTNKNSLKAARALGARLMDATSLLKAFQYDLSAVQQDVKASGLVRIRCEGLFGGSR